MSLTPALPLANLLVSFFFGFWNLLSGFVIQEPDIPPWWIWGFYVSAERVCVCVDVCVRACVATRGPAACPHLRAPPPPPLPPPPPPPTLQICYPTCTVTDVAAKELETVSVAEGSVHYSLDEGGA